MIPDPPYQNKWKRLWGWACARGFLFVGYVMIAIGASYVSDFPLSRDHTAEYIIRGLCALMALILIVASIATATAVVRGLNKLLVFLIKLEIPALRILAVNITALAILTFTVEGDVALTSVELGIAALLLHEMRAISHVRKEVPRAD